MSRENWKRIWNQRSTGQDALDLPALIALDGFDHGAGKIEPDAWREYARLLAGHLQLAAGESVFEVGCGSGALLYALRETLPLTVGGIDYSAPLIAAASRAIPDGAFECGDAVALDPAPQYHHVISNSVFQYFSLDEAEAILDTMLDKATRSVAILDVPSHERQALSEQIRRDALSEAEYRKKYAGLEHTYYTPAWFAAISARHQAECRIVEGFVPGYRQNAYRFSCFIRK